MLDMWHVMQFEDSYQMLWGAVQVQTYLSIDWVQFCRAVEYPGILFGEGSTNSVEDRENGDLGALAP